MKYPIKPATLLWLAVLAAYAYMCLPAITDLSAKSYWLFMDERLSFDGIRSIYTASSFSEFIHRITYGDDLRYGRLFWNFNAVTSYIPYLIWGDQGQIIASRITEVLLLTGAFWLLSVTFIKDSYLRLLAFTLMLFLQGTQYFATMPKPEPLQLFVFALFLYFALSRQWKIAPYVILMGICMALKISFLPVALLLFLFLIYKNRNTVIAPKKLKPKWVAIVFTILLFGGLVVYAIIEPKLTAVVMAKASLPHSALATKIYHLLYAFLSIGSGVVRLVIMAFFGAIGLAALLVLYKNAGKPFYKLLLFIFLGVIICTPCILFIPFNRDYLTFLITNNQTGHPEDNPAINFFSWMEFISQGIFKAPGLFLLLFLVLPFAGIALNFKNYNRQTKQNLLLLCVLFAVFTLPIMAGVHRLWGHYLFIGFVFFITLYLFVTDNDANKICRYIGIGAAIMLLVFSFISSKAYLHTFATRTQTPEFKANNIEYKKTVHALNAIPDTKLIYWDPYLFYPDKVTIRHKTVVFVRNFDEWGEIPDIIVLSKKNYVTMAMYLAEQSPVYKSFYLKNGTYYFDIPGYPYYYQSIKNDLHEYVVMKKIMRSR